MGVPLFFFSFKAIVESGLNVLVFPVTIGKRRPALMTVYWLEWWRQPEGLPCFCRTYLNICRPYPFKLKVTWRWCGGSDNVDSATRLSTHHESYWNTPLHLGCCFPEWLWSRSACRPSPLPETNTRSPRWLVAARSCVLCRCRRCQSDRRWCWFAAGPRQIVT